MIQQGDPDLTAYLHESFWTNEPQQIKKIFFFPTPESWKTGGSHPNIGTNPQRTNWTQRERKTQSTEKHIIPN